ncbi:MAG: hypothetical protein MO852_12610 [Candidatus Devosia euplotis]|nr:hypothetical protein [Candidatus Devosia euplotis]
MMAKQIVDGLEIVGVDHQQGACGPGFALGQQSGDPGGEGPAIEAGGQAVCPRHQTWPGIAQRQSAQAHAEIKKQRYAQNGGQDYGADNRALQRR